MHRNSYIGILVLFLCSELQFSFCACPKGFHQDGTSSCYRVSDTMATWVEAKAFCEAYNNGHLVTIESQQEQNLIEKYLKQIRTAAGTFFYTGMTDAVIEGDWVWVGNTIPVYFSFWASGEPNEVSVHDNEDCMVLIASGYRWFDADCYTKRHYICETSS